MSREELAAYRRSPGPTPAGWGAISPGSLRFSDDQTVAAVAAVLDAIDRFGDEDRARYDDWGILVASRFLGRANLTIALHRFRAEGVWGVSPHLIPHYALHSPSGALSLVLGVHGPNLGIGGGPFAAAEGVLAALSWLGAGIVPGLWLVLTEWSPEFVPDREGKATRDCRCQALALATVPADAPGADGPRLRAIGPGRPIAPTPLNLPRLAGLIEQAEGGSPRGVRARTIFHAAHDGAVPPRPHVLPGPRRGPNAWTLGTDAAGRMVVELAAPETPPRKEAP